jgi:uncharacterized membrane protein YbhN (UPF0104 family)
LLVLVLYLANAGQLLEGLRQASPVILTVAAAVAVAQFFSLVWRWQLVARLVTGDVVEFSQLTLGLGRSMLYAVPLPSTVGGDVVRVALLTPRMGLAFATRSVVCDRVLGMATLVLLVAALLPLFAYRVEGGVTFAATAALCAIGLVGLTVLVAAPSLLARVPLVGRYAATVGLDFRAVLTGGGTGALCIALALAGYLLLVPLTYFLASAFNAPLLFVDCFLIVPLALLASSMPISLGGWGVREGAMAAGFALVGGNVGGAVAASVVIGLLGPITGVAVELIVPLTLRILGASRRRV